MSSIPTSALASRPSANVTLKQIAQEVGVSHQLVSFALNDTGRMTDETRLRIKDTAQRLGYRRNGSAMTMKNGRFGGVALLLSTNVERSGLPQELWEGVHDTLASRDLHLTMARLPDEKLAGEGAVPRILREYSCDGLLIDYTHSIPSALVNQIEQHHLPAIWINVPRNFDSVRPDDFQAGFRATEHLLALGHRHIAYFDASHHLSDLDEHYSGRDRLAGYEAAMQKARQPSQILVRETLQQGSDWLEAVAAWFGQKSPSVTGVVTYGDFEVELLSSAAGMLDWVMGRDLSVVSFDFSARREMGLRITTFLVPNREVGARAVEMLLQKIEAPQQPLATQVVPFGFEEGQTCAPPRNQKDTFYVKENS